MWGLSRIAGGVMLETGEERVKGLDYFSLILPTEIRREQHRIKVRITPEKGEGTHKTSHLQIKQKNL